MGKLCLLLFEQVALYANAMNMCIAYGHFSQGAVAGESNAVVMFSMLIAAVDIVLLAMRWLWCEQFALYG